MREQKPVDFVEAIRALSGSMVIYGLEDERNRICTELVRLVVTGADEVFAKGANEAATELVGDKIRQAARFCRLAIKIDEGAVFRLPGGIGEQMRRALAALGEAE